MRLAPFLLLAALAPAGAAPIATGLYNLEVPGGLEAGLASARKGGFSLAVIGAYGEQLDAIQAAGMKAVVALWLDAEAAKSPDKAKWEVEKARIKEKVSRLKGHPALGSWYVVDEPDGDSFPLDRLVEAVGLIRSVDPKTPLLAVFDKPRRWAAYFPHFDILCVDPYLRRRRVLGGYDSPEVVTQWLKMAKQDLGKRKGAKLCAVLGAFDIRPKAAGEAPGYRKPTPAEFKDMAARARAEGADPVFVYAYALGADAESAPWNLPKDDPKLWEAVQDSMRGLSGMGK